MINETSIDPIILPLSFVSFPYDDAAKNFFLFALDLFVVCFECFLLHPILCIHNLKSDKYTLLTINKLFFTITGKASYIYLIISTFSMSLFNKMTLLKWANKDENRCVAICQLKVLNTHSTAISSFIKIT